MKPGRFILNSDYCTTRNVADGEIKGTIPNSYTTPAGSVNYVLNLGTATVGDPTDNVSIWYTSSKYNYATYGATAHLNPAGAQGLNGVSARVSKNGNVYTLKLIFGNQLPNAQTYTGYGMTITAHIHTFKDPFSE